MKLVHISDTHIGFSNYYRRDPATGLNQREVDFRNAFKQAVDKIVEDIRPHIVLHTGDVFHGIRPSNHSIVFAMEQFKRITDAGIPVVVIGGNHSSPRSRDVGHVLSLLRFIPNVHAIYDEYEAIRFPDLSLVVHAIPHSAIANESYPEISLQESKYEVLMIHAAVHGVNLFSMRDFNEQVIPIGSLTEYFDYIALGHYHEHAQVKPNAYYAGSLERVNFNDLGQDKGFCEVDLDTQELKFHRLNIRPMLELPPIDATNMTGEDLASAVKELLTEHDIADTIVRLRVENLLPATYQTFNRSEIDSLFAPALHKQIDYLQVQEEGSPDTTETATIEHLYREFTDFMSHYEGSLDRERLTRLGIGYLQIQDEGEE